MARKAPTRTCIACGKSGDKRAFVRVVRTPQGGVVLDTTGRAQGRGAYLCKDAACLEKAVAGHLLDGRLRTKVSADDYKRLEVDFCALLKQAEHSRDGE